MLTTTAQRLSALYKSRSRRWFIPLSLLFIAGCGVGPAISSDVSYEYPIGANAIRSYRVEFTDMPEFLKPMLRDEASRVLATKGLSYTEGTGDAVLMMSLINRPLDPDVAFIEGDDGEAKRAVTTAVRFDARVEIEMRDSVSRDRIWSATMNRVHYAPEGAYMHEEPAREAMRSAFRSIFANFPTRMDNKYPY